MSDEQSLKFKCVEMVLQSSTEFHKDEIVRLSDALYNYIIGVSSSAV